VNFGFPIIDETVINCLTEVAKIIKGKNSKCVETGSMAGNLKVASVLFPLAL
jgi:hypothetical protein